METLWAPWRMEYILGAKTPGCIFCPPADGGDRDRLVLYRGRLSMVMMNRYPYNNGHLLVSPLRHAAGLDGLAPEDLTDLVGTVRSSIEVLKGAMRPEGFNVGMNLGRVAGAGVEDHLHFHIVPRWNGDTNMMTVLGEVRVIPEHLLDTYDRLAPLFARLNED
ncbi:MAG: HIT domain-containing protein [Pseudomonadota bacterium]